MATPEPYFVFWIIVMLEHPGGRTWTYMQLLSTNFPPVFSDRMMHSLCISFFKFIAFVDSSPNVTFMVVARKFYFGLTRSKFQKFWDLSLCCLVCAVLCRMLCSICVVMALLATFFFKCLLILYLETAMSLFSVLYFWVFLCIPNNGSYGWDFCWSNWPWFGFNRIFHTVWTLLIAFSNLYIPFQFRTVQLPFPADPLTTLLLSPWLRIQKHHCNTEWKMQGSVTRPKTHWPLIHTHTHTRDYKQTDQRWGWSL